MGHHPAQARGPDNELDDRALLRSAVLAVVESLPVVQETSIYPTSTTKAPQGAAEAATPKNISAANVAKSEAALDPNSWRSFKVVEKSPVTANTFRLRSDCCHNFCL